MTDDPRIAAARYRAQREDPLAGAGESSPTGEAATTAAPGPRERAGYIETAIQQAIRRGDFDDLPGAGKPIEGLGSEHDPDWWIRRKIRTEQLSGLGPPALMLRTEDAEFAERVDALGREEEVREYVADFNHRVIEARRQLLGGPPVITPTRDVEDEVAAWARRRRARAAASPEPATPRRRRRFGRR